MRPGVQIVERTTPPSRSAPTDTGVAFMAGLCDRGGSRAILAHSLDEFVSLCGGRVSYSVLYDVVDHFFREGGNSVYIGRVVGPAAVAAHHDISDDDAEQSLVVTANSVGDWGNGLKVAILAGGTGGTYQVQIEDLAGNVLENSGDLTTQQDAVTWSTFSSYVVITLGTEPSPPAPVAHAALAGGTDDRGSIDDARWAAALALFTADLGPGQVAAPGRTTDVGHTQLCDHAAANNRDAVLDAPNTATEATLLASAAGAAGTGNGQFAGLFGPWHIIPGVVAGTQRVVPPSGAVCGLAARVDASDNPNTPPAGDKGVLRYTVGLTQNLEANREALNLAGVNVFRSLYGGFRLYGWRSLANPVNNPDWVNFSTVRYLMWLSARCEARGEAFVFKPIDGQGHTISQYGGALTSLVMGDYSAGIIFGETSSDAFNVDVGPSVNTPTTIADDQLRAIVAVRPSPFAELVSIEIVNVAITEAVA